MKRKIALLLAVVMLGTMPCALAAEEPPEEGQVTPYRIEEQAEITDVQTSLHEGDITLVTAITVKTDTYDALTLRLKESTVLADAADGSLRQMESITRARRKVQADSPELKDGTVTELRAAREEEFREYANAK